MVHYSDKISSKNGGLHNVLNEDLGYLFLSNLSDDVGLAGR